MFEVLGNYLVCWREHKITNSWSK